MATLWERKSKKGSIFYLNYTFQGKRHRISTGTGNRELAELFQKDIEVKIAELQEQEGPAGP